MGIPYLGTETWRGWGRRAFAPSVLQLSVRSWCPSFALVRAFLSFLPSQGAVMHVEGPMQFRFHQYWAPPLMAVAGVLARAVLAQLQEQHREPDEKLERMLTQGWTLVHHPVFSS